MPHRSEKDLSCPEIVPEVEILVLKSNYLSMIAMAAVGSLCLMAQPGESLKVLVVKGEGAFNSVKLKEAQPLIVEVRNDSGRPIPGAHVSFTLPFSGPSGTFSGGARTYETNAGPDGRATTEGYKPNSDEGRFNIKVAAVYQGNEGSALISQTNTRAGGEMVGKHSNKKYLWLAVIGGGAGAGAAVALGHGSKSAAVAPTPATAISVGPIAIGGPH
jgi:hypothetical protein